MNPEISPWMKIADKQKQQAQRRFNQQKQLQRLARLNYQRQLRNQMQLRRSLKKQMLDAQRQHDKQLINSSINEQKRLFEIEKLKVQASNERQLKLDIDNDHYQRAKKQRQILLKKIEQQQQLRKVEQNNALIKMQQEQQQRKKQQIRQHLINNIQYKQIHKKQLKDMEVQYQKHKMDQLEAINDKLQIQRHQYLKDLKVKAQTIDYGAHGSFQRVRNQSLVERKRQQWQTYKDSIERQQQVRQLQKLERMKKLVMEKQYRNELRQQINENQNSRKNRYITELQSDKINSKKSAQFNQLFDIQKNMIEKQKKQMLNIELQSQMNEINKYRKRQPYIMQQKQAQLNSTLLRGSNGIIPGETYNLDPARRKQLQAVAKSMSFSPSPVNQQPKYFAQKGKSIIG